MKPRLTRILLAVGVTALGAIALAGCSGAQPAGSIIVIDGSLRAIDADCAGSGVYLAFHAGAELSIVDGQSADISTTTLDSGTAIPSDTKDYGVAKRVPSYCAFDFDVTGLTPGEEYSYSLDGEYLGKFVYREDNGNVPAPISYPPLGDPQEALKGSAQ